MTLPCFFSRALTETVMESSLAVLSSSEDLGAAVAKGEPDCEPSGQPLHFEIEIPAAQPEIINDCEMEHTNKVIEESCEEKIMTAALLTPTRENTQKMDDWLNTVRDNAEA